MAEKKEKNTEKKKVTYANSVRIVGYLKENNLEQVTNTSGDMVIRGSLVVATDKISSHKIQFYVSEKNFVGEPSADYEKLCELLPQNTVTIASFLKNNPEADFESAINSVNKVWVIARFDEYASRSGERVSSIVTLRGSKAGFVKVSKKSEDDIDNDDDGDDEEEKSKSSQKFIPGARFKADVYINKLDPELDEDDNETGRLILEGILPKGEKNVNVIQFVCVEENDVAKFISSKWKVGDTVRIDGEVISLQERRVIEESAEERFGKPVGPQYETFFIRERRVDGGSAKPKATEEEGKISEARIKDGLAEREVKMAENGAKAKRSAADSSSASAASADSTSPKKAFSDALDF